MRLVLAVAACVILMGCGNDAARDTAVPSAPESMPVSNTPLQSKTGTPISSPRATAATRVKPTGIIITTAKSQFGMMLFDSTGQAIYLFEKEQTTKPECYGACAEAWPPVLTSGTPAAAGVTRQDLLDTTKRTDGTTQVTYGGHPLYYYAHEAKNEVKCHNIQGFGGLWLVVTPAGRSAAP